MCAADQSATSINFAAAEIIAIENNACIDQNTRVRCAPIDGAAVEPFEIFPMNLRFAATASSMLRDHRGPLPCARDARLGKDILRQD